MTPAFAGHLELSLDDQLAVINIEGTQAELDDHHHDEDSEIVDATAAFLTDSGISYSQDNKVEELAAAAEEAQIQFAPGGGGNGKDTRPPRISNVAVTNLTYTSATINWTTSELADTQIEYGTTSALGTFSPLVDTAGVKTHSQVLSNLQDNTLYYYRVLSKDLAGNLKVAGTYSFQTPKIPDTTPPVISNVGTSNLTWNSVQIGWTTNEPSTTQIEYGTTTSYGTLTSLNSSLVTNHSQSLATLNYNTTYHYRVRSRDADNNLAISPDYTFTTAPPPPNTPPVITLSTPTSVTYNEGQPISIIVYGSDAENNPLTYTVTNKPSGASFTPAANGLSATFAWTPSNAQHGVYSVTFNVYDTIDWSSVTVTITVNDVNAPPAGSGVNVSEVDADFNLPGYQVYEGSYWSAVTYSSSVTDPDATALQWSWSYRLDGGSEILFSQGTSTTIPAVTFDYAGKAPGMYEWILRASDGVTQVQKTQTTQVLAGTWAAANTPAVFLDFDGTYLSNWGSYSNITVPMFDQDGLVTSFNTSELTAMGQVLLAVIEKFSIFGIAVFAHDLFVPTQVYATPGDEFQARNTYYTNNKILQVAIGGNSSWLGGSYGGVAYVNSFTNSIANTVFAFSDNLAKAAQYIWEASAHEAGHAFGLYHQKLFDSNGRLIQEYNPGANGIAPIMGNSYGKRGLWWYGTSASSTSYQDDVAIISKTANTFGLRPDDHGNGTNSASALTISGTSVSGQGIIGGHTNTTAADVDYFEFTTTTAGNVNFALTGAQYGAMLDIKVQIFDAAGNLVASRDTTTLGETISGLALNPGTYYLVVNGHGLYGDVGQYWISGSVPAGTTSTGGPNALSAPPSGSSSGGSGSGLGGSDPVSEFFEEEYLEEEGLVFGGFFPAGLFDYSFPPILERTSQFEQVNDLGIGLFGLLKKEKRNSTAVSKTRTRKKSTHTESFVAGPLSKAGMSETLTQEFVSEKNESFEQTPLETDPAAFPSVEARPEKQEPKLDLHRDAPLQEARALRELSIKQRRLTLKKIASFLLTHPEFAAVAAILENAFHKNK